MDGWMEQSCPCLYIYSIAMVHIDSEMNLSSIVVTENHFPLVSLVTFWRMLKAPMGGRQGGFNYWTQDAKECRVLYLCDAILCNAFCDIL